VQNTKVYIFNAHEGIFMRNVIMIEDDLSKVFV